MNKREIAEIKRRFKKESCTFTRVCGCYVNSDKAKVVTFRNTFLNLEDEELHKYLEIANKTLSGKPGNSLLELPFPMEAEEEGGAQALLMELRSSQLKDDEVLNRFYDRVIETYDKVENYLILLFHDAYDVPMKTTDNLSLDDSEEVYEYIMCAICPVDLSKPGLGYNENENRIGTLDRDWVVGAPESGFTFPCFTERSTDIHAVMVYTKDAKQPHTEFWENGLGCKAIHTSTQKKMAFTSILGEALGDPEDEDVRDTMLDVQQGLSDFIEIQTETQDKDEPVILNREELSPILENSGIDEPVAERIADKFDAYFEEKGIEVLADVMSNVGGVVGSYFEWVQNRTGYYWTEEEYNERLAKKMREAYEDVYALKEKYHVTYRLASYMLALSRVVEAEKTRGFLG